jgi:hypothetical protein
MGILKKDMGFQTDKNGNESGQKWESHIKYDKLGIFLILINICS